MPAPQIHRVDGGSVALWSARCPGKERPNEDAAAVINVGNGRSILAVADGLGGQPAGARAAALAVESLARCVAEHRTDESLRPAIIDAFERANTKVTELGVGAATTLAVVEIDGTAARPYHAGDSMIVVAGQRSRMKLKTVSHSPVGYAVEAGLLDEHEAMHHEDRHLISNMLGCDHMHIEVGPTVRLRPRDTIILASDGLFDNLHVEEIVELARVGPLVEVADRISAAARRRMLSPEPGLPSKPDDVTFIIHRSG
ncbi:MAG: PP2C family protein-serine/threonine phosphatase [Planctomycetota bacterium]